MKYFFGLLVLCLILFVEINLIMNLIEQRYQIGPKYNNIIQFSIHKENSDIFFDIDIDKSTICGLSIEKGIGNNFDILKEENDIPLENVINILKSEYGELPGGSFAAHRASGN